LFLATRNGAIYAGDIAEPGVKPILIGTHPGYDPRFLEISPDGRYLLSLCLNDVRVWDLEQGAVLWRRDNIGATCVSIAPDSQRFVCGNDDGQVFELDLASGRTLRELTRLPWCADAVKISGDGQWLAAISADGSIRVLSWPSSTPVWQERGSTHFAGRYRTACFSPCGRYLVTPAVNNVCNLTIWNVETGQRLGDLRGHTRIAFGARFAKDGRLVSWAIDGTIRVWDVERQTVVNVISLDVPPQST
jgi:WD40 repeat protein